MTKPLIALSTCRCGANCLHDHIELGTKYELLTNGTHVILRDGFHYTCGACGVVQSNVVTVLASTSTNLTGPKAPVPALLFFTQAQLDQINANIQAADLKRRQN